MRGIAPAPTPMDWSTEPRSALADALARESARIGFPPNERLLLPADPAHREPDSLLALLRSVPDGAGVGGWLAARRGVHPLRGRD